MDFSYIITPFLTWLVAGSLKFVVNSIKAKRLASDLVGYGGLPSNHSAIVSSMVMLIALKEGVEHPAFGVALTLAFIVMLDANSLRRRIGEQAAVINMLAKQESGFKPLRERMGHTRFEIAVGLVVGCLVAIFVDLFPIG